MTGDARAPVYERAYLVACDPRSGRLDSRHRAAFLVRAGVLIDLAYRRAAHEAGGRVHVGAGNLADPVLAEVASELATTSRSWRAWTRHRYKQTLALAEAHLSAEGVLIRQQPGGEPDSPVAAADLASIAGLQAGVRSVLSGREPVQAIDRADAAVASLAVAGAVPLVPRGHRARYRALAAWAGDGFPGIEPALRKLRRTIIAARGGMG